jgi:hypothetical protein
MADSADDRAHLLAVLNARGQDFLAAFEDSAVSALKRKADVLGDSEDEDGAGNEDEDEEEEYEEWGGIDADGAESDEGVPSLL